ncbi:MAG: flagellar type III secretion system pore protein FliP [SAR324 cluster bacterium]|nr:flagellar type III secretion system pore protein FliP [SAR324 cluster bacterium]
MVFPLLFALLPAGFIFAQNNNVPIPYFDLNIGQATNPNQVSSTLQVIALLTILSLAPAILLMMTSFTRFIIVLSLLRTALGTQQAPPNQVLVGLSLFLTLFVMAPVWQQINQEALQPYLDNQINQQQALDNSATPLKDFMVKFTREKDLALFVKLAKIERPNNVNDVPLWVVIPAFMISELKTAFQIGFIIYIPFLVIDMVVSSILLAMGMMMLPPSLISLPFKIMLFVLADGWNLLVGSLTQSFFK